MKQMITTVFLALFMGVAFTCSGNNIIFTNQAQIDNFINTGITAYPGDIRVNGPDITNLDGLQNLVTIEGTLIITNCPVLTDIDGLNGLTSARAVIIRGATALTSIEGMNNLTEVGYIDINNNQGLTSISGFNGLTAPLGLSVEIWNHYNLTSITGFSALTSIWGTLNIQQNYSLTDISGFSALTTVEYFGIYITSNDVLTDISPLQNVTSTPTWVIAGNYNLSACSIQSVCGHIAAGNPISIWDNASGCLDAAEVGLYCTGPCAVIPYIASSVQALALPNGLENALLSKLNNAINSFQNGNTTAGINQLNAFINQVNAHSGGNITVEDAAALIAQAQGVIGNIENGGNPECVQPLIGQPNTGSIQFAEKTMRRSADLEALVFPNPTRGSVMIQLGDLAGKQGIVQLIDQHGRSAWQSSLETLGAIHRLDLSDFAAGMYFMQVKPEGEAEQTVKVIVGEKE